MDYLYELYKKNKHWFDVRIHHALTVLLRTLPSEKHCISCKFVKLSEVPQFYKSSPSYDRSKYTPKPRF